MRLLGAISYKKFGSVVGIMDQALQTTHNITSPSCSVRDHANFPVAQLHTYRVACHGGIKKGVQNGFLQMIHDDCSANKEKLYRMACFAKQKKGTQGDGLAIVTEGIESDDANCNGSTHEQILKSSVMVEERSVPSSLLEVDSVTEAELKERGLRGTRRTKLVCTIGPACCSPAQLEIMAKGGMNVARINMCHGTKEWHAQVIRNIRKLNVEKGYNVAIMMDTEGSEVHMGDLGGASFKTEDGEVWTFTVRKLVGPLPPRTIHVNYEGFAEDVITGDELVVDGGMVRFEVIDKVGPDVHCRCNDPGLLLPRANLTFWRGGHVIREGNSMLPTLSSKDWIDIDFGIAERVDFIAISFVRTAEVVKHLKSYIAARSPRRPIGVIAKIESCESLQNLEDIIVVSDGAMVGRSDLGAQIPLEQVPSVQQEVVQRCRQLNKPVIVASQLVESMIEYPTPTRAEVADVSEMVRQGVDALMLSGESAMGQFPEKALGVLRTTSLRMEEWCREEKIDNATSLQQLASTLPGQISEEICNAANLMANKLEAEAIFVYTKGGYMASLLSRNQPKCPIFAFTDSKAVQTTLNLRWGLIPIALNFSEDMEGNLERTFSLLKTRGLMKAGDLIVAVSDLPATNHSSMLQSIQVRRVP